MSLLTVVQEFCRRTGLSAPSAVALSQDPQVRQMLALCNELVTEMVSDRYPWRALIAEATFSTVAGESQGQLTSLAPGYRGMLPGTLWSRAQNLPIIGPLGAEEWQSRKAMPVTGTSYQYRIRGNELLFSPEVTVPGELIAFEYRHNLAVRSSTGTGQTAFLADTDTYLLPEELLLLGLRWKWREEKGLEFITLYESWLRLVKQAASDDGTKPILDLDRAGSSPRPGIFVPYGNYTL